jgi:predicted nucleotidyltransferase
MGTSAHSFGLSDALFSRVQARVLGILFGAPDSDFAITEIIDRAGSGRGAVQRELKRLTDAGIVALNVRGSRKLYQANRESPVFPELRQLIQKTIGAVDPIREVLLPFRPSIACAFVYGSVARGRDTAKSDIDLMIIADTLTYSEIFSALQSAEKILARPINPNLMTPGEWQQKIREPSGFIANLLSQPKLFIFGTENDLGATG